MSHQTRRGGGQCTVDPKTARTQVWKIPSGGGVVRHMVSAPDGTLWLACSGVDRIARVKVKTNP